MKKALYITLLLLTTFGMNCRLVAGREIRIHLSLLSNQHFLGKSVSIAKFPQGSAKFAEYVLKEFRIPQVEQEIMPGFDWYRFILSYDSLGKLESVTRDPGHEFHHLEPILLSFFRGMPDWTPATKGVQAISCKISLELTICDNLTLPLNKDVVTIFDNQEGRDKYLCDKFYNQGVACFAKANYNDAVAFFDKAIKVKPDDVDSWFNKGASHYKLNEVDKACESWQAIVKIGKKDQEVEDLIRKNCKGSEQTTAKGNEAVKSDSEVFTIVETSAEFPGGFSQMLNFIQNNITYPDKFRNMHLGGKTFLKFIINENGEISNTEILKSSGVTELDNESLRLVSVMPKWKPAEMQGKKVKTYFNLPFSYALSLPYYVFNSYNKNEKYIQAWTALLSDNPNKALELYSQDTNDVEAWYNMAVIHFYKGNKKESKKYFEKVKDNVLDRKNQHYVLADKFLTNNF